MGQAQRDAMAAGGFANPNAAQIAGMAAGGVASSRANPLKQYYAMVCSHASGCQGRHWFSTVHSGKQVICPQCNKPTTFSKLVEGYTRRDL